MSKNKEKSQELTDLANCIRFLGIDAVQKAKSGHPGMPMGMADIATVLYKNHLTLGDFWDVFLSRDYLISLEVQAIVIRPLMRQHQGNVFGFV